MRYRCKAWHEQYPDAGKAGAGTKGLEFLFAALPLALRFMFSLTQATEVAAPRGRAIRRGRLFAALPPCRVIRTGLGLGWGKFALTQATVSPLRGGGA